MIQLQLADAVRGAIARAQASGALPTFEVPPFEMERPKVKEHGDWATGIALVVAKGAGMPPRKIAEAIVAALGDVEHVSSIEIAGPGFINFVLSHTWLTSVVRVVEEADADWGRSDTDDPEKVQVEFVSANPTGPMHLGHGRWAAIGDTLANLLAWTGHTVEREFYINDFGAQVTKFGQSIEARYRELLRGEEAVIPEGGYHGEYVKDIASEVAEEVGERYIDAPEDERLAYFRAEGQRRMLEHQRQTLRSFGVEYDVWFSERSLHEGGAVERVIGLLTELGHTYESEGALWLRTTDFGDDKDRVLVRSDGRPTYVVPDAAYFLDKLRRGFRRLIYLLGADHHGWVRTMRAIIQALGEDPDHCEFLLGQFVHLKRGAETVSMSKRQGEGVSFDQLLAEVGRDVARYHFLRIGMDQTVEFDLDVVVAQSLENPVYYVQYSHARICSIMRNAEERGIAIAPLDDVTLGELQHESEQALLRKIAEFPEVVDVAARLRAPHRLTRYAEDLAADFNAFYRDCHVLIDDPVLTQARLHLCRASQITLRNVLGLLGVGAPERM